MDGTIVEIDGRRVVSFQRHLKHSVERVWQAITRPEQLTQWMTVRAKLELRVDGSLTFRWENGEAVNGRFTKIDPPVELEYTWIEPSSGKSVVLWRLQAEGDGCMLQLSHTFEEPAALPDYLAGWHVHLDVMESVLRGAAASPYPWDRVKTLRSRYAAFGNNAKGEQ